MIHLFRMAHAFALLTAATISSFGQDATATLPATDLPERSFVVDVEDGEVCLAQLCEKLFECYGFDAESLSVPAGRIRVVGLRGKGLLVLARKALLDTVRFELAREADQLTVIVDQWRTRLLRQQLKGRFLRWVARLSGQELAPLYSLEFDLSRSSAEPRRSVILVHGLESSPAAFNDLRGYLQTEIPDSDCQWGSFGYPDDEAVDVIAEEFSRRLKDIGRQQPQREVIIVAHSMGGLVSRWMLETPALNPGNVSALIMLGTPQQGSYVSHLRPLLEPLELLRQWGDQPRFLAPFVDGLGEASWDLWPGSPLLQRLNRRERAAEVCYTAILGNKGVMTRDQLQQLRDQVLQKVSANNKAAVYSPKLRDWFDRLDEVVDGEGDGAVSVDRGKLAGATDHVVPLGHQQLLKAAEDQPAFRIVLQSIREQLEEK